MPETLSAFERPGLILYHTPPALEKADKLILIVKDPFAYRGANHRIQSGAITAARQYSNSHLFPCSSQVTQSIESANRLE